MNDALPTIVSLDQMASGWAYVRKVCREFNKVQTVRAIAQFENPLRVFYILIWCARNYEGAGYTWMNNLSRKWCLVCNSPACMRLTQISGAHGNVNIDSLPLQLATAYEQINLLFVRRKTFRNLFSTRIASANMQPTDGWCKFPSFAATKWFCEHNYSERANETTYQWQMTACDA